jgi:RimJ/RimL family protein N-acetyltransferase
MQIFPRALKLLDMCIILKWRNDYDTIYNSKTIGRISPHQHFFWFFTRLNSEKFIGIVFENGDRHKVALVTFSQIDFNTYLTSININPKFRGKGLAQNMIASAIEFVEFKSADLYAEIKETNVRSIRAFTNAGFVFFTRNENEKISTFVLRIK